MEQEDASLERKICKVTGKEYETGAVLLDKTLKKSMDKYTVTGFGISPEAQNFLDSGFVALVVIDVKKSVKPTDKGTIGPEDVYRIGEVFYLKEEVFAQMVNMKTEEGKDKIVFIDEDFANILKNLNSNEEKN